MYIEHLSAAKTGRLISKDKRDWVTLILFRIIQPGHRSLAESVLFSGLPIYTCVERQLAGWLADWLVGWLTGCSVGWLVGSLVGWLAGWLAGTLGLTSLRFLSRQFPNSVPGDPWFIALLPVIPYCWWFTTEFRPRPATSSPRSLLPLPLLLLLRPTAACPFLLARILDRVQRVHLDKIVPRRVWLLYFRNDVWNIFNLKWMELKLHKNWFGNFVSKIIV